MIATCAVCAGAVSRHEGRNRGEFYRIDFAPCSARIVLKLKHRTPPAVLPTPPPPRHADAPVLPECTAAPARARAAAPVRRRAGLLRGVGA
jgi:hypothetical protein